MQVEFGNKELLEIYTKGHSPKCGFPKSVIRKFFMRIESFEAAKDIYDLWNSASLHFKRLKGYAGRYSVRLNKSYRLLVDIQWQNKEKTIGKIIIKKISKHYAK